MPDRSCQTEDGKDDLKKGTQLLEVYALEIQMHTEQKNNKKLKVGASSRTAKSCLCTLPELQASVMVNPARISTPPKAWEFGIQYHFWL